ncbi:excinuclease ABC subunit B, partial [Chlamydia psittaci 08-2626_L3]
KIRKSHAASCQRIQI